MVFLGGSYYYHWMRDAGLSIKAWIDINDNDYDKIQEVLSAFTKWVKVVQNKPDPNDIDVRIGKSRIVLLQKILKVCSQFQCLQCVSYFYTPPNFSGNNHQNFEKSLLSYK